jgi:GTPase SAR1 family protein
MSRQHYEHGLYNPKTGMINTKGKIITINGHGGVGKTTLKEYLITYIHENTKYNFDDFFSKPRHGVKNCKLVDNSKSICFIDDYQELEHPFMYTLQYDIIFIFDYKSFEYLKNIDIHKAFVINYDIQSRYKSRPAYCKNLSKDPISFINNIYHCEPLYKI